MREVEDYACGPGSTPNARNGAECPAEFTDAPENSERIESFRFFRAFLWPTPLGRRAALRRSPEFLISRFSPPSVTSVCSCVPAWRLHRKPNLLVATL